MASSEAHRELANARQLRRAAEALGEAARHARVADLVAGRLHGAAHELARRPVRAQLARERRKAGTDDASSSAAMAR